MQRCMSTSPCTSSNAKLASDAKRTSDKENRDLQLEIVRIKQQTREAGGREKKMWSDLLISWEFLLILLYYSTLGGVFFFEKANALDCRNFMRHVV